jgi:hypothetical protein
MCKQKFEEARSEAAPELVLQETAAVSTAPVSSQRRKRVGVLVLLAVALAIVVAAWVGFYMVDSTEAEDYDFVSPAATSHVRDDVELVAPMFAGMDREIFNDFCYRLTLPESPADTSVALGYLDKKQVFHLEKGTLLRVIQRETRYPGYTPFICVRLIEPRAGYPSGGFWMLDMNLKPVSTN